MKKLQLNETFASELAIEFNGGGALCEGKFSSNIDGQYIIGMVEGQFFKPDGMSRNGRWYSKSLWETVLASSDVKNRFLNSTMLGEIGHSEGPVTDMTLRSGDASHFIADLWIDEKGRGMGRAYIINTETGRRLKTYLGATCKLKVSTRGEGIFLDGETKDGCPIIDPNSYELQTVDFVLNPGFLETSATLKIAQLESVEEVKFTDTANIQAQPAIKSKQAPASKEGEQSMTLDMDMYVRELKEELAAVKAENKSLTEELKSKDKELLEKTFIENAEIKKINEEFAPFKKMNVTAKTLNETLKRSQEALAKSQNEKIKISEELQEFKDKCGSIEQVEEATKLSEKALNTISEYQKLGSVSQLKELMEKSEAMLPKLQELATLTEYKKLGSIDEFKTLAENCKKSLPLLKQIPTLEAYQKLGSVEDIQSLSTKCESLLPKLKQLKDAEKLAENVTKVLPKLQKMKQLEAYAKKAHGALTQYLETVGSLQQARQLVESRKETIKKVSVKEALEVSKKYGCTVESAAKLLKKYGNEKTTQLLESKMETETPKKDVVKLGESTKLIEEVAQMDTISKAEIEKTAKDYVSNGMVASYFDKAALGTKFQGKELGQDADCDKEACECQDKAKALINSYLKGDQLDVDKLDKDKDAEEAEKIADKLLK